MRAVGDRRAGGVTADGRTRRVVRQTRMPSARLVCRWGHEMKLRQ